MPLGIFNQQWLNLNSQRAYPLFEEASREDLTGSVKVPDEFLVGLRFPVHAGLAVEAENFYLQSLVVTAAGARVTLGYDDGTSDPPAVAAAAVDFASHTENAEYALAGQGDFDDCVGSLAVGRLTGIRLVPPGFYTFAPAAGRVDASCIFPSVSDVRSLVLVNGSEESERLTGDIILVAGTNLRLSVIRSTGQDPTIRIDAVSGEGFNNDCACVSDLPCIKTINGVGPDDSDNITLLGNECLTVEAAGAGLKLTDTCSAPCCGCEELEVVTRALELQNTGLNSLTGFVNSLSAETRQFANYLLGTRLCDAGCF